MPPLTLTPALVRSLRAKGKRSEFRDKDTRGLALMVYATGARVYVYCYNVGRRNYRIRLGAPSQEFTLAKARKAARLKRAEVEQGGNPMAERRRLRTQAAETVGSLVAAMLEAVPMKASTAKEWRRLAAVELAPLAGMGASDLARADVRLWMGRIAQRSKATARHALEVLRRAYSWGLDMELVGASPCAGILAPKLAASERVLSTQEVRALALALEALGTDAYPDAVRLLLYTGVRREMVLGARVGELEGVSNVGVGGAEDDASGLGPGLRMAQAFGGAGSAPLVAEAIPRRNLSHPTLHTQQPIDARWTIPGERCKSGRPHVVPLSPQALAVIRRRLQATPNDYLFTTYYIRRQGQEPKPSMGMSSGWVRQLKLATRWALWCITTQNSTDNLCGPGLAHMEPWKLHGLRHTMATHMREDLRVDRNVVALILGHAQQGGGGATRIYDRSELLPERRAALLSWGAWVESVAAGAGARVLPMRRT